MLLVQSIYDFAGKSIGTSQYLLNVVGYGLNEQKAIDSDHANLDFTATPLLAYREIGQKS